MQITHQIKILTETFCPVWDILIFCQTTSGKPNNVYGSRVFLSVGVPIARSKLERLVGLPIAQSQLEQV